MADYSEYKDRDLRGADGIANNIIARRKYPDKGLLSFLIVEGPTDKMYSTYWLISRNAG